MSQSSLASDQDPATQSPISMALIDPKPLTRQSIRDVLTCGEFLPPRARGEQLPRCAKGQEEPFKMGS